MADWSSVALRLALSLDAMLTFGLAAFIAGKPVDDRGARRLIAVAAVAGVALTVVGLVVVTAGMAGVTLAEVDAAAVSTVLATAVGVAAKVRIAALVATAGLAACSGGPRLARALLPVAGGIALASLAWSGHGAMDDGAAGVVHLAADIVHLLAAGVWFGALVGLVRLVAAARDGAGRARARVALAGFATTGTVVVALLTLTGAVNAWFLVGPAGVPALGASRYGQLLVAKLALFAVMLALAARHRFRLTPALVADAAVVGPLRRSLALETAAAIGVVALVAWLGTLPPPAV